MGDARLFLAAVLRGVRDEVVVLGDGVEDETGEGLLEVEAAMLKGYSHN